VWRETRPGARELWNAYLKFRNDYVELGEIEAEMQAWFEALPKQHPARTLTRFKHVDKWGPWRDRDISWPGGGGPRYGVENPTTGLPVEIPERGWIYSTKEKMQEMIDLGLVVFRKDKPQKPPIRKAHLRPVPEELVEDLPESDEEENDPIELGLQVMGSVIYKQSQVTMKIFRQIMAQTKFSNPKDHEVLARVFDYVSSGDQSALFLDSFAGSGTTAHAVLALNKEDSGNRRFILCQMPYEAKEQEKDKENICETITAERIRRVIKGVPAAKDESLRNGLGGTFSYFRLGKELHKQAILDGKNLPSYEALAGYVFFTATGEEFKPEKAKPPFVGSSRDRDVFLIYEQDIEKLKDLALNLEAARSMAKRSDRKKLVFAPTKYLDQDYLERLNIEFCQLPFEIYQRAQGK
jgi:adenine-specific DNA-methyltransferase